MLPAARHKGTRPLKHPSPHQRYERHQAPHRVGQSFTGHRPDIWESGGHRTILYTAPPTMDVCGAADLSVLLNMQVITAIASGALDERRALYRFY